MLPHRIDNLVSPDMPTWRGGGGERAPSVTTACYKSYVDVDTPQGQLSPRPGPDQDLWCNARPRWNFPKGGLEIEPKIEKSYQFGKSSSGSCGDKMLPALHSQFKPREGETQENSIVITVLYPLFVANINFSIFTLIALTLNSFLTNKRLVKNKYNLTHDN